MKHTLDPLPQVMASLQENKSLYKKAFIRRCQNLRKAENEVLFSTSNNTDAFHSLYSQVDILGDQVDILLSLIEKIYSILNQQSPALQQYFDVSEILRSIAEEVPVIACTPPVKLDTSSDV
ncbi:hypothetical protein Csa_008323 [Cucumis sativus]|uniref:Uncharacterized protein n=1 Tax=Cucumis sativus TaxID=3659 RepID=A0A0A0KRK0_CUCSA|nr:hypothetical protein Csa_008323 [Cucumis sativus]